MCSNFNFKVRNRGSSKRKNNRSTNAVFLHCKKNTVSVVSRCTYIYSDYPYFIICTYLNLQKKCKIEILKEIFKW